MNDIIVTDVSGAPGSASLLIGYKGRAFMYDSGFGFCAQKMADSVESKLHGSKPEAILLSHSHYDHVMGAAALADRWGGVPIVAGEYAAFVFTRPTAKKKMLEMDINAATEFGYELFLTDMTDRLHADVIVKDGEVFDICGMTLRAISFPGHTNCSMGFFHEETRTLFSSETLGVCTGGKGMPILLTSFIDGERSLERAMALGAENIIHPHFGMMCGKDRCDKYFHDTAEEFSWVKETVLTAHRNGKEVSEIIDILRGRYHSGSIKNIYPEKAFDLNTGYMVPKIIEEFA